MTFRTFLMLASSVVALSPAARAEDAEVLRRLETLEKRIQQLEERNGKLEQEKKALEEKVDWRSERLEKVENKVSTVVKPDVSPTVSDPTGSFSFKVRGVLEADYAGFTSGKGGYVYNNGTGFRRARLGGEGTAFKDLSWRFEVDFASNVVAVQDAYVAYTAIPGWTFTLGQTKAPFGLESNNSDNNNVFIERGMANNAFGTAGAERRLGVYAQYAKGPWTAYVGFSGDNESSVRADTAPGESYGFNGRLTWEPINDADLGRVVHVGAASYWRTHLKQASGATTLANALRLSDRPNVRVDGGTFADTGVITNVKDIAYLGGEAALVYGSLSVQSEYGRLHADRTAGSLPGLDFDGGYVFGSWFITGESRRYRNGLIDRLRPLKNFSPANGGTGAVELVARYDWFDFAQTPVAARLGNEGHSFTLGANWYLNPNIKLMGNWVHFAGNNTPLNIVGTRTEGDAYVARLHIDW